MINNFLGAEDKFVWWKGVVEHRDDPLCIGRAKVRIFGWHTQDKAEMPTEKLPWSYPLLPLDNGTNTAGVKLGDWVVGFFRDGTVAQEPIMTGVIPGIPEDPANPDLGFYDPTPDSMLDCAVLARPEPQCITKYRIPTPEHEAGICDAPLPEDEVAEVEEVTRYPLEDRLKEPTTSRVARKEVIGETIVEFKRADIAKAIKADHINTTVGTDIGYITVPFEEPITPYNPTYPFNHVYQSEAGHYIEVDDTPNDNQRLHWYHRAGTFKEIHPNGTQVEKIRKNCFNFIIHDYYLASFKTINITSTKGMRLRSGAEMNMSSCEDMNRDTEGKLNTRVLKDANTLIEGFSYTLIKKDVQIEVEGNVDLIIGKTLKIKVGENVLIDAGAMARFASKLITEIKSEGPVTVQSTLVTIIKGTIVSLVGEIAGAIRAITAESIGLGPLPPVPPIPVPLPNNPVLKRSAGEIFEPVPPPEPDPPAAPEPNLIFPDKG